MTVLHTERLRLKPFDDAHFEGLRQGLASEAALAMASFAFETLQAPLLLAVRDAENTASRWVMEGLGMHERGLERWCGRELPTHAMTAADWRMRTG